MNKWRELQKLLHQLQERAVNQEELTLLALILTFVEAELYS